MAWLLSESRLNNARCCVSTIPTLSWRHLVLNAATQDDFSVSSWLVLRLLEQRLPSGDYRFSAAAAMKANSSYPSGESVSKRNPEGVVPGFGFMVLVSP